MTRRWLAPALGTARTLARRVGALAALVTLSALAACGGGGGGGDGFSISFDRSSVSMSWSPGDPPQTGTVGVLVNGTPNAQVYLGADTPTGQPDPNIADVQVVIQSETRAQVIITPTASLPVGSYTGELVLLACLDPACTRHVSGSPHRVSYRITVAENFRLPVLTTLLGEVGVPQSAPIAVTLPPGVGSYVVSSSVPWMTARDVGPTGFTIDLAPQAQPGSYSGQLTLSGGGLQRTVTVSWTVGPRTLALDTTGTVTLTAPSGSAATRRVGVLRLPDGQTGFTASVGNPEWASIEGVDAQGFTVRAASLPEGHYETTVQVSAGTAVKTFQLALDVTAGVPYRGLSVAQTAVTLTANEGTLSGSSALGLQRPSWNETVTTAIQYSPPTSGWLSVDTLPDGDLRVRADARGLAAGTHLATVVITPAWPGSPLSVPVQLSVGQGIATPAPLPITVTSDSTAAALRGTLPVRFAASEGGTWSAQSLTPWLRVLTPTGAQGEDVSVEVDPAQVGGLSGWTTLEARVRISGTTASPTTPTSPVEAVVNFRREFAEIDAIGPAVIIAGQVNHVIVRGRGFAALQSPAARLSVNGLVPAVADVTRLNDQALRVRVPAMAGGPLNVAVEALLAGAPLAAGQAQVQAPVQRPNWSTPNVGGEVQAVFHSAAQEAFFEVNKTTATLVRTRWSGSAWVSEGLPLPGLQNAALSPDGNRVVALLDGGGDGGNGSVRVIDAGTLATLGTYAAPFRAGSWAGHGSLGLAVTTEGRVWLTQTSGWTTSMSWFDLRSNAFGALRPSGSTFYYGPWYTASRDGERLGIVQSSSTTAPYWTMSASNNQVSENPIGLDFHHNASGYSDDASRLLWSGDTVYDRDFNRVGLVRLSSADQAAGILVRGGVIAPDGRRAYLYDLPSDASGRPTGAPRIRVIDTSTATGTALPVLRTLTLSAHAGCDDPASLDNCIRPAMNITADGRTLLITGHAQRMIVDVSEEAAPAGKPVRRLQTGSWRAATPWKLTGR